MKTAAAPQTAQTTQSYSEASPPEAPPSHQVSDVPMNCDALADQRDEFFYGDGDARLDCEWDALGFHGEMDLNAANDLRDNAVTAFLDDMVHRDIFDPASLGNHFSGLDPMRRAFAVDGGSGIPLADLAEALANPEGLRDLAALTLSGADVAPANMRAAVDAVVDTLADHYAGRVCEQVRGEVVDRLRAREREISAMIAEGGSEEFSVDQLQDMLANIGAAREWTHRELMNPRAILTTGWGSQRAHAIAQELFDEHGASPGPVFEAEHRMIANERRLGWTKVGVDIAVGFATGGLSMIAGLGLDLISVGPELFALSSERDAARGMHAADIFSDEQLAAAERDYRTNVARTVGGVAAGNAVSRGLDRAGVHHVPATVLSTGVDIPIMLAEPGVMQ